MLGKKALLKLKIFFNRFDPPRLIVVVRRFQRAYKRGAASTKHRSSSVEEAIPLLPPYLPSKTRGQKQRGAPPHLVQQLHHLARPCLSLIHI